MIGDVSGKAGILGMTAGIKRFRKIVHLDLDAFFCSVEELLNQTLIGLPFAVGGQPGSRSVVSTCSYAARAFGVRSAMPVDQAIRLCPQLKLVSSNFSVYHEKSRQVMAIFHDLTPLVQPLSIDEAFLDISDLPESGEEFARNLQTRIMSETGLPSSLGVASNKLVAKTATDFGKQGHRGNISPMAVTVVPNGGEAAFLAPLPVRDLWGVGPKTADRLLQLGLKTIGDIAAIPQEEMIRIFGKGGLDLSMRSRGIDDSPVECEREAKSISQEITFVKDVSDRRVLLNQLRSLSSQVGYRLRQEKICAGTIRLKLRWPDFSTITRQARLAVPTDQDMVIFNAVEGMLMQVWKPGRRIRLIGVGSSGFGKSSRQPGLWVEADDKEHRLLESLDKIREKFGEKAVVPGYRFRKTGPGRKG
jgi:DNA polymerase-4